MATLLPLPSTAALVSIDLFSEGDEFVTRDIDRQLDWLDLPLTAGESYASIEAGITSGWIAEGWRQATADEVCGLFLHYALAPSPCPQSLSDPPREEAGDQVSLLSGMLGLTDSDSASGMFSDLGDAQFVGLASLTISEGTSRALVVVDARALAQASFDEGHFLVRPVPEPMVFLLDTAALSALATVILHGRLTRRWS